MLTLPGGDPDPVSWAITIVEGAAALAGVAMLRRVLPGDRRARGFWWAVVAVTAALGLNKQLDVQSGLLAWGRDTFAAHGWLGYRALAVAAVTAGVLGAAVVTVAALTLTSRLTRFRTATLGIVLLLGFAVVRTATIGYVGESGGLGGHAGGSVLEAAGALLVLGAALWERRLHQIPRSDGFHPASGGRP